MKASLSRRHATLAMVVGLVVVVGSCAWLLISYDRLSRQSTESVDRSMSRVLALEELNANALRAAMEALSVSGSHSDEADGADLQDLERAERALTSALDRIRATTSASEAELDQRIAAAANDYLRLAKEIARLAPGGERDRAWDQLDQSEVEFLDLTALVMMQEWDRLETARKQASAASYQTLLTMAGLLLAVAAAAALLGHGLSERQRREALAAAEMKSQFLANMSHEIRTPMNVIIGMTELALESEPNERRRQQLSMVQRSGEQLLRVINDILDFSRIDANRLDLEDREIDLRQLAADVTAGFAPAGAAKGVEVSLSLAADVPAVVRGDSVRLRQVFTNLVGNAMKFTEKGSVKLSLGLESMTANKLMIQGTVADTGIGIPLERQAAIFEAFAQADGSSTRRFGGSGLGLAIVSRLLRLMHGDISVESEPGKGSTFTFRFEVGRVSAALQTEQVQQSGKVEVTVAVALLRNENRDRVNAALDAWGFAHATFSDSVSALAAVTLSGRGVVVTDTAMLEADGGRLMARYAQHQGNLPLVLVGARPNEGLLSEWVKKQPAVAAPVSQSHLLEALMRAAGSSPEKAPKVSDTKVRVLLAEDVKGNRMLISQILDPLGHEVTEAVTGKEAVEKFAPGKFDLVLMDVNMPEMNGLDCTRKLREREQGLAEHVRIYALTAHAMDGDKEKCLAAGMDGYLSKPLDRKQLLDIIREIQKEIDETAKT